MTLYPHVSQILLTLNGAPPPQPHSGLAAKPLRAVRGRRDSQLGMSDVAIDADFTLPIAIAGAGLAVTGLGNIGVGFPISVVGLLLAFQATRVVFQFDDEVRSVMSGSERLDFRRNVCSGVYAPTFFFFRVLLCVASTSCKQLRHACRLPLGTSFATASVVVSHSTARHRYFVNTRRSHTVVVVQ